jgi:16S rRNA G1207 methylase RsmC
MPQAGPLLEAPIQLSKLLQIGVNDRPHEAALVSMEGVWSWSNLDQATNRLAAHCFDCRRQWPSTAN